MKTITIKLENDNTLKNYEVELEKLLYILSKLENNKTLKFESLAQIEKLIDKYKLYDEDFLSNINNIW